MVKEIKKSAKDKGGFFDLNLGDIKRELELDDFVEAYWVWESLKAFHRSGEPKVEHKHLRGRWLGESHIEGIQQLWEKTCDPKSQLKQSHAGYLKLFVDNLCRRAYRRDPLAEYNVVLLDEAHDTDPVVERLFRHLAQQGKHSLVQENHLRFKLSPLEQT